MPRQRSHVATAYDPLGPEGMPDDIFRQEALAHHSSSQLDGEVLLMLPRWAKWTYRLLIATLVTAVAFLVFAVVPEYSEGPAVIRADQNTSVTAALQGIVAAVVVRPGMAVAAGDVLVRFKSAEETAQIVSLQREFDSALVRMLANPTDQATRQTLGGLRAQKELMASRLSERTLRAPDAGTVGDVRVKAGQSVAPGDVMMSITSEQARFSVLALLPGQQRPSLHEGQALRLEFTGYQYVYKALTIERVDDGIVGPSEVRRMLGPEIADSIPVAGPVVLVHARLTDTSFVSAGEVYHYFDGMHATVRARLRSERLLTNLIPGTKLATERTK